MLHEPSVTSGPCPAMTFPEVDFLSSLFVLNNADGGYEARGFLQALPSGGTATLGERVRQFFDVQTREKAPGPAVLVGALPFDPQQQDFLYQPEHLQEYSPADLPEWRSTGLNLVRPMTALRVRQTPTADEYAIAVDQMRKETAA